MKVKAAPLLHRAAPPRPPCPPGSAAPLLHRAATSPAQRLHRAAPSPAQPTSPRSGFTSAAASLLPFSPLTNPFGGSIISTLKSKDAFVKCWPNGELSAERKARLKGESLRNASCIPLHRAAKECRIRLLPLSYEWGKGGIFMSKSKKSRA